MTDKFHTAVLWQKTDDKNIVSCHLCGFQCQITEGQLGHCKLRKNIHGELKSMNFDKVCSMAIDPIEKKPLFHFLPGSKAFSVAAIGCNFKCSFCQNWQISQMTPEEKGELSGAIEPEHIIDMAVEGKCDSIAYTYTEPTMFMELCCECGKIARQKSLKNIFVSNGFMTRQAIDFASDWLDAVNIDLKSFSEDFYRKLCKASLKPVLESIEHIAKNTDIWLELTTLIIPNENDSDDELKKIANFIVEKAGCDVPWHISRFYPQYRCVDRDATSIDTLQRAYKIGQAAGLKYIYIGNAGEKGGQDTVCHNCSTLLIKRSQYNIISNCLENGQCPKCNATIAGVWI